MANNWLVMEMDEGADQGNVKLLASAQAAQEYMTARIAGGVSPERVRLFNASDTPFSVSYQPVITIGSDAGKAAKPNGTSKEGEPVGGGVRFSSMFKSQ